MQIPSVRLLSPGARTTAIVLPARPLITACSSGEDSQATAPEPEIDRTEPVFDGFSQIRSVISITSPGGEVLRMSGAPEISRLIEACS